MFGTVNILDKYGKNHHATIAKINEPYFDGAYIRWFKSQIGTLMWDSIDIILEDDIEGIREIIIKELRDVECDKSDDGYCLEGCSNLKVLSKHYFGEGKVLLKCL